MKATYINHMGSDLDVVNAARYSFDAESDSLTTKDIGLIGYLARGCRSEEWEAMLTDLSLTGPDEEKYIEGVMQYLQRMPIHWAPFAHEFISLNEEVPIFIARQRFKHTVGVVYSEKSRRYVKDGLTFYLPETIRLAADDVKQGSAGLHPRSNFWRGRMDDIHHICEVLYHEMIADKVAPEQARASLPQSMMTTYRVSGSLYSWTNAYNQRNDPHAQLEIQELAHQWKAIIEPLFPISWAALTHGK